MRSNPATLTLRSSLALGSGLAVCALAAFYGAQAWSTEALAALGPDLAGGAPGEALRAGSIALGASVFGLGAWALDRPRDRRRRAAPMAPAG